ncbi:MAG: transglycosylase SLT domain-containing protein [Gemmatimonadaceae bacterium]|nr:transglycosylase SLT domain-containing protein [Gemmatimonadaceae bacterium]
MSNDVQTFGTMFTLLVGGAAGYAAGRWIVEPWLATHRPGVTSTNTPRRSLSEGPIDPYAGPSAAMQPIDPYADAPVTAAPIIVATSPIIAGPAATPATVGPITSPSQVDGTTTSPVATAASPGPITAGPITSPSQADGPIASPVQVAVAPPPGPSPSASLHSRKFATPARVRRFDSVFERYRDNIPLAYIRALVDRESNGRPDVRTGSAVGLMQIVPVVLADYNKRHGTAYQNKHLVDPATNVAIGCELLQVISNSYRKNHPRIPNFQPDWNNPRFVELLTFGWNAGFSEAGGIGRVARYLERLGAVDITLDQVTAHARIAGASKHLSNSAKVAWCKSVVALYERERALVEPPATLVA